ncbi:MAG: regulatory protein RecX [Gammaproteobacteria bacterium]
MLAVDADQKLDIEAAAIRLLSQTEQTFFQLKKKLLAKGFEPDQVIDVLNALESQNLLSDKRFAEQYLSFRSRKGFGPLRITQELREKGVDENLLDSVIADACPDWSAIMQTALQKKFGATRARNYKDQAKRARFLESRGFPASLISQFVFD